MKRFLLFPMAVLLMLVATVSCEKDAEYVAPRNITIELTPNPCAPGDTVTAKLVYGNAGENWYWYKTTSGFNLPKGSKFVPVKVDYDKYPQILGACNSSTYCRFSAPETAGTYAVEFSGQISVTACKPGESIWGERIDCSVNLTVAN